MNDAPGIPISQRVIGSVLICIALFMVDPTKTGVLYQLAAPLCLALGTYLVTRAHVAIAGTIAILALLGSDLQARDPMISIVYPVIGVLCAAFCLTVLVRRFRTYSAATHDARWSKRR